MTHILPATVIEKARVVCQLFTPLLGVKMARPGPFYDGTYCLKLPLHKSCSREQQGKTITTKQERKNNNITKV